MVGVPDRSEGGGVVVKSQCSVITVIDRINSAKAFFWLVVGKNPLH